MGRIVACIIVVIIVAFSRALAEWAFFPYHFGDVGIMKRVAKQFQDCNAPNTPYSPTGNVVYYIVRNANLKYFDCKIQMLISNRLPVCIAEYEINGVTHRAFFSTNDPPVNLGVYYCPSNTGWIEISRFGKSGYEEQQNKVKNEVTDSIKEQ